MPVVLAMTMCVCVYAGVDESMVVTLKFSRSRLAVFTCSVAVDLPNDALIVGTKGTVKVPSQHIHTEHIWNIP